MFRLLVLFRLFALFSLFVLFRLRRLFQLFQLLGLLRLFRLSELLGLLRLFDLSQSKQSKQLEQSKQSVPSNVQDSSACANLAGDALCAIWPRGRSCLDCPAMLSRRVSRSPLWPDTVWRGAEPWMSGHAHIACRRPRAYLCTGLEQRVQRLVREWLAHA
jgi:hypothetical protein